MKSILGLLALTAGAIAQPVVTSVLDGAAYTNNIAQGSVFVVKGTGLSSAGYVQATAPNYLTTLNNVRITMTAVNDGAVVTPLMAYTYNVNGVNQLAAVLPSSTAEGVYDLRVENSGTTSAPFRISVVKRKPGIVTASSDGAGPAQATLDGKLILQRTSNQGMIGQFETRSAHPGERIDLWGTGLGPDDTSDTGGTSGDQTVAAQVRVFVNGTEVTPTYAGRSQGTPGLDQIVFNLPTITALSCTVDVQVRAEGVWSNIVTIATATGDACPPTPAIRFNEVESNGGTPGDWVELYNYGSTPVDLTGYIFKDNDDTHIYTLPATIVAPGGYLVLEEAQFGFGLGAPESARLFRPDGTLVDAYSWSTHASTTYARCPDASGAFSNSTAATKGAANVCDAPVKINEVESDSGSPGDWIELYNVGTTAADISGFILRDNDDTHTYTIPAGTVIPAGGYWVAEEAALGFGLGGADSARLLNPTGTLLDSYAWTAHATTSYGRCPNGTGSFVTTTGATKGAANACPVDVSYLPWPGGSDIRTIDNTDVFNGNMSGLVFEASGASTIWAVRNGPGTLFRLVFNGTVWTPDTSTGWSTGRPLRYPEGAGDPDSEGVTFAGDGSANGIYVSTERNNSVNNTSRNSILRFDPTSATSTLMATHEWNLTSDLPTVGPNLGMEGITWVPDSFLTSRGFFDESKNHAYNPAEYPRHGTGLFFVGLEADGMVYAYALDHGGNGQFTRVATIATGLAGVMDLTFDRDRNDLWVMCDDTCQGRSVVLRIETNGKLGVASRFERPTGMPNLNNEGFAIAPTSTCANNTRSVFWTDDAETDGHAIRTGTLSCTPF